MCLTIKLLPSWSERSLSGAVCRRALFLLTRFIHLRQPYTLATNMISIRCLVKGREVGEEINWRCANNIKGNRISSRDADHHPPILTHTGCLTICTQSSVRLAKCFHYHLEHRSSSLTSSDPIPFNPPPFPSSPSLPSPSESSPIYPPGPYPASTS